MTQDALLGMACLQKYDLGQGRNQRKSFNSMDTAVYVYRPMYRLCFGRAQVLGKVSIRIVEARWLRTKSNVLNFPAIKAAFYTVF